MNIFRKFSTHYTAVSGMDSESKRPMMGNSDEEQVSSDGTYEFRPKKKNSIYHLIALYTTIVVLFGCLLWKEQSVRSHDPSIGLWSPAQHVVQYQTVEFGKYFQEKSPYTEMPTKELDDKWEDLYNFGLSGLSEDEADKLHDPTVHLPHDDSKYVVTLAVFHQLHCVNHLRKALYPDEYPGLWQYHQNGTVNHDTILSLHWDHCLDIIRQALMCQSDITPMPFFYRESDDNIYSSLETTHYCRNFDDIRNWAKDRQVTHWVSNGQMQHSD